MAKTQSTTTTTTSNTSKATKAAAKPKAKQQAAPLPMPTPKQARALQAAVANGGAVTRKVAHHQYGLPAKGWAALLGAHTKGNVQPGTMQGLGWVTQQGTGQPYSITAAGKAALARYVKANGQPTLANGKPIAKPSK